VTNAIESGVIRVGIVGASVDRGWAAFAHIPALRSLSGFALAAVCTTKQESADRVARHFGIPLAFSDPSALARSEVDLVVVTVKAPGHFAVATAALEAGKSVYCEWPLGKSAAETRAIRELAQAKGLKVFCGLQARNSPTFRYLRELIAKNHIGKVLSANVLTTAGAGGATVGVN
jgi:predicted dehydrogenase